MRASTLFAITVAVLVGLAVAVLAKVSGIFNRAAPPPAAAAAAPPEILVLTPTHNLFKDIALQLNDVTSRPVRPDEMAYYEAHKDEFMAPLPQVAALRVPKRNLEADRPIMRSDLYELGIADPIADRLAPGMRSVNTPVAKDDCSGGLIKTGDWVDVHLTTTIESSKSKAATTQTATIVRAARVIAKRNILWNVMAPLPDNQAVPYTLEMNPYRAALVEFCRDKGKLSLVPLSAADQRELEAKRHEAMQPDSKVAPAAFSQPDSGEYKDEDERVNGILRGDVTVSESDLMRIFGLKLPVPAKPPLSVQMFIGIEHDSNTIFGDLGRSLVSLKNPRASNIRPVSSTEPSAAGLFEFRAPGTASDKKECTECKKKQEAAKEAFLKNHPDGN